MVELIEYVIFAGVLLFMGFLTIRVAVSIIKQKSKAISAQQLLAALGFKNFHVLDLDKLQPLGFQRLLLLIRELKPTSIKGVQAEFEQMMQFAQGMGMNPAAAAKHEEESPNVLTR